MITARVRPWLPPLPIEGHLYRESLGSGAVYSPNERYRYMLWLDFTGSKDRSAEEVLVWLMLNPSTATESNLDPTLRRCVDFTRRAGYKAMVVINRYALRATYPSALRGESDPAGPLNQPILDAFAASSLRIVCGWGTHGGGASPIKARREMWCLGINSDGSPKHPLYLPADTEFERWESVEP